MSVFIFLHFDVIVSVVFSSNLKENKTMKKFYENKSPSLFFFGCFKTPEIYKKALEALRKISSSGNWPETTSGRLKVIEEESTINNGGSFSMGYFPLVAPRNEFLECMYLLFFVFSLFCYILT